MFELFVLPLTACLLPRLCAQRLTVCCCCTWRSPWPPQQQREHFLWGKEWKPTFDPPWLNKGWTISFSSTGTKKGLIPLICFKLLLLLWEQMSGKQCTLVVWQSKYSSVVRLLCYTCAQCDCVLNTVLGKVDLGYLALLHNKYLQLPDYHPLILQTTNCTKHEISCKRLSHQICIILDIDKATSLLHFTASYAYEWCHGGGSSKMDRAIEKTAPLSDKYHYPEESNCSLRKLTHQRGG